MTFEPLHANHAISEVAFAVRMTRPWQAHEIKRLVAAEGEWKTFLPKTERINVAQFVIGAGPRPPAPVGGVAFERIQPDGHPEWRLAFEGDTAVVNCLKYTRWDDVWPIVSDLLASAFGSAEIGDNLVKGMHLQYIDQFYWRGSVDTYRADQAIRAESELIPQAILQRGVLWHHHQGWFDSEGLPMPGRMLERINIDSVLEAGRPKVQIDTTLRLDLADSIGLNDVRDRDGSLTAVFANLHDRNKRILRSLLVNELLLKIGMGES